MHVFHIKGFSGLLMFLLALLALVAIGFAFPTAFLMTLWNAVVFESFQGKEIDFWQASLLWGVCVTLIRVIFQPEISLQFHKASQLSDFEKHLQDVNPSQKDD